MTGQSHGTDDGGGGDDADPTVINSIAVTIEDALAALEATEGTGRDPVLRVTPPFSGRMRARLHLAGEEGTYEGTKPIHISPARLVAPLPAYPTANETAAELDPDVDPNTDQHHQTHTERLDKWRETVCENLVDTTEIATPAGTVAIEVRWLGESERREADQ